MRPAPEKHMPRRDLAAAALAIATGAIIGTLFGLGLAEIALEVMEAVR